MIQASFPSFFLCRPATQPSPHLSDIPYFPKNTKISQLNTRLDIYIIIHRNLLFQTKNSQLVCIISGGRNLEIDRANDLSMKSSALIGLSPGQHQTCLHACPGFVAPHCPRSHFHPPNYLLGAIIGPGDSWIRIESTEARPGLTQPDEQIPQLFERSELVDPFPPTNFHLFPQSIQAFGSFWG